MYRIEIEAEAEKALRRLRVGYWRALYTIDPGNEIIAVLVIKAAWGRL